jgi:hypothetical protein
MTFARLRRSRAWPFLDARPSIACYGVRPLHAKVKQHRAALAGFLKSDGRPSLPNRTAKERLIANATGLRRTRRSRPRSAACRPDAARARCHDLYVEWRIPANAALRPRGIAIPPEAAPRQSSRRARSRHSGRLATRASRPRPEPRKRASSERRSARSGVGLITWLDIYARPAASRYAGIVLRTSVTTSESELRPGAMW